MSVAVVNAASMQPDEIFYDITKHCNTPLLFAESFFNLALTTLNFRAFPGVNLKGRTNKVIRNKAKVSSFL